MIGYSLGFLDYLRRLRVVPSHQLPRLMLLTVSPCLLILSFYDGAVLAASGNGILNRL